jgi:hypothetical protein
MIPAYTLDSGVEARDAAPDTFMLPPGAGSLPEHNPRTLRFYIFGRICDNRDNPFENKPLVRIALILSRYEAPGGV